MDGHTEYNLSLIHIWWKIESGIVNFKFTGIASNENGEFYIKDGKVDFDYSGTINQSDCIYTVKSGWVVSKEGISGIIKGVDVSHHNNDNGEGVLNCCLLYTSRISDCFTWSFKCIC